MPSTVATAPVGQVAVVTSAMMGVTCTAGALGTWAAWHRYGVAVAYVAGEPGTGVADYVGAANTAANVNVLWLMAYAVTCVTFLTWSWRARLNAEQLTPVPHRLARGWVVAGWVVPAFPLIAMEDVWRTSRPDVPSGVEHARSLPRAPLVRYWWCAAMACVLAGVWLVATVEGEATLDALLNTASAMTVLAVLQTVAAGLAVPMIRQITRWQSPNTPPELH
ncbi:DUF4328 domain-containing protein [Actinophytocola oryzae]|uniref:Uncharacterized protein DUF4328 n=1 Tax=Actinophytocola oryzae TaxID=502181 RepID=A0A4V3FSD3_9PSEU|nr:DUF4328 domain-containing protein [Actinophytocola oryzae]TDV47021.1 uncharacterized protein DUF4328 [Actinophytocola oryzae]